jgi:hypothetical protein
MHIKQYSDWDPEMDKASLASLTILDILRFRSPLLEGLTITMSNRVSDSESHLSSALSTLVCSLQHLQHLHCGDNLELDLPSLVHLASLPDLQILRLPINQRRIDQISSLAPVPPPFPKLFEIGISVHSLEVAIKFIPAWKFKTTITTIRVHVDSFPSATSFHGFFDAIVESSTTKSVTQIDIHCTDMDGDEETPEHGLDALTIKSLFVLTKLEVLKLTAVCSTHELDDIFLEEVAAAWPHLRVLHICWSRETTNHSPKITLNGLAALLKCHALTDLSIAFDSHAPLHPLSTLPKGNLQSMTFAQSSLQSPSRVVLFFTGVFPNLSLIDAYNDCGYDEKQTKWQDGRWEQTKEMFRDVCESIGRDSPRVRSELNEVDGNNCT